MSLSAVVLRTVIDSSMTSITSLPPTKWYEALARCQQRGVAHVMATVVAINGSAPRALQAKMIVTLDDFSDTLGGGGLEHDVISTARQLLNGEIDLEAEKVTKSLSKNLKVKSAEKTNSNAESSLSDSDLPKPKSVRRDTVYTKHYPLGAKLAQCCGGSVTIMFECFNVTPALSLLVFGAGHVASALMTILAELPCQVDWVDSRPEMFERYLSATKTGEPLAYHLPKHIRVHIDEDPVDYVRPFMKQGGKRFILVMTHDHSVDFELVRAALEVLKADNNFSMQNNVVNGESVTDGDNVNNSAQTLLPYIGCISSATKAKRFKDRLLQRGYDESLVDKLTMPIGLPLGGKEPMAVAVSIVAQIMQQHYL